MADKKITELTNITGANLADADEFVVVDSSASETKAITYGELKNINGNLNFADNGKAIFGAGSDLQIYHNGSDTFIDSSTGNLYIRDTDYLGDIYIQPKPGENGIIVYNDSSVSLFYDNTQKLTTTSTGVDVTGTVTADGLTVDGVARIQGAATGIVINETDTTDLNTYLNGNNGSFRVLSTNDAFSLFKERINVNHTTGNISFYEDTGTTPKFFWDASAEALGIGTSSPAAQLHLAGQTNGTLRVDTSASGYLDLSMYSNGGFVATSAAQPLRLGTNNAERLRIDSSGNLLVGTTNTALNSATSGEGVMIAPDRIEVLRDDAIPMFLNRLTSDGEILRFNKSGTTVGGIGAVGGDVFLGTGVAGLRFADANPSINPHNTSTNAVNDGAISLGTSSARFRDIYATNGTIQTSDANEKQDIDVLSDAEQRVAVVCKGLLRKFRWKDAVAEKGNAARIHFGIIAQDLKAAFEAEGLDAGNYAMFIHSTWTDEETGEERSRMGVRYPELLAFIIAAI